MSADVASATVVNVSVGMLLEMEFHVVNTDEQWNITVWLY